METFFVAEDRGVVINGGRPGAGEGALAILKQLETFTPFVGSSAAWHWWDAGLLPAAAADVDLSSYQQKLIDIIAAQFAEHPHFYKDRLPVFLGGGHDFAYPFLVPFLKPIKTPSQYVVINMDAHLDVRSPDFKGVHSGTPFYQLLTDFPWLGAQFFEWGVSPTSCSAHHYEWVKARGAGVQFCTGVGDHLQEWLQTKSQQRHDHQQPLYIFLSVDIDVMHASLAPGCSAPAGLGVDLAQWRQAMQTLHQFGPIVHLSLYEYAPRYDHQDITARLAAQMIHQVFTARLSQT